MSTIDCDVLVVGSGAAGISAALAAKRQGLDVLVVDKEPHLGGTTAISGGWLWVPGNRQGLSEGDSREEAETYIKALAGDSYDAAAVSRFLDLVPEALEFFENNTRVEFHYPEMAPDYQMDTPGARKSGRALTVKKADARMLKEHRLRVQPYLYTYTVFGYMPEIGPDIATFLKANRSLRAFGYVQRRLIKTWLERLLLRRALTRTNGNALMTRLIASAGEMNIPMWTNTRVTEVLKDDNGTVTGAVLSGARAAAVHARCGVVIAAGGFSGSETLRSRHFGHDLRGDNHVTPTVGHQGDSYFLAKDHGGVIDSSPHQPAAWGPVTVWRNLRGRQRVFPHLRAFGLPGLIAVNRRGHRFANESYSYHDFGVEMLRDSAGERDTTAWIISDRKAMRRYGIGYAKPWPLPTWYYKKVGYLVEARSVQELADRIGVPGDNLERTLAEFNADATKGTDSRFDRGSNWFHHFKGDMEHEPNPNLAPIDTAPYYAVRIQMGDLGTYAGLSVNDRNEVRTASGNAVPGLYAVGTAAVSVFGGGYPGYGANIGPAMVFGYQVGRDIAAHAAQRSHTSQTV
ncbi:FAD-dependent oxidoreductase [Saccharopolyspora sp. TS4A08]|uniref:FAD-dependent oxidoreductase n=1 Tax=Saccharopolyspora ipomoeae TaxID=3042027 RepID=A0ABT6PNF2_9PSEU|nr:FAD-dependent oxidoreductase [Saccharopolyspora sp. TS4A08]MDI2029538.1 FAD-dependent oxidoreductase [Saccharopolyspora sp. TS4A08]